MALRNYVMNIIDIKKTVKDSYEKNNYMDKYRNRELLAYEKEVFDKVISLLSPESDILDLGCGNGYPYDYYFSSKHFYLTGIDFCENNIKNAKINNPKGTYICSDIENYMFREKYDCIMALFSILHIPRERHKKIFKKIYDNLKNNGIFLITLRDEDVGDIKYRESFCEKEMYWSYYDYNFYINMLKEIGFKVLYSENQNKHGIEESHNWVILKK